MARGQLLDGGLTVAELAEDFSGVLAEQRRDTRDRGALAVPADGKSHRAIVRQPRMLGGDQDSARFRLSLGGDPVESQNWRARHAGLLEAPEHLLARERARDC